LNTGPKRKLHMLCEKYFSEHRLYLRTDNSTRYLRLTPITQMVLTAGAALFFGWTIFVSSAFLVSSLTVSGTSEQSQALQVDYETRLNDLSGERDKRALEAQKAQERFYVALEQISAQQSALLASEDRRRELETGIEVIQRTLRKTMKERDRAAIQSDKLLAELQTVTGTISTKFGAAEDVSTTVDFLNAALANTVNERDTMIDTTAKMEKKVADLKFKAKLVKERNSRIFARLEEAVTVSMDPLEKMFEKVGMSTDKLLEDVKLGYSGQGGPLLPLAISSKGEPEDPASLRANSLLLGLDTVNMMRIAAERTPFMSPLRTSYRLTSPFGPRKHPVTGKYGIHPALDMAGPYGTAVYATGEGVVSYASWRGAYGRVIIIRHANGYETRFAHLQKIRVKVGQRVSQGERIGDMGSSGRSTGSHVHYEVRIGGKPINPMNFIKASRNVF
jgi:murein DD-endopeptidase MepM/ murein hydrolase activator NlpD